MTPPELSKLIAEAHSAKSWKMQSILLNQALVAALSGSGMIQSPKTHLQVYEIAKMNGKYDRLKGQMDNGTALRLWSHANI